VTHESTPDWSFWQFLATTDKPKFSPTVFSDQICSNSKKENKKRKRMMGWIENGPKQSGGNFLSINSFPPKLKRYVFALSVLNEEKHLQ
jgi:hypothetical protein